MATDQLTQALPEGLPARLKLGEPARALLRPGWTARQYLDGLIAAGHLSDAIRLLAYVLPRREAVWWACQCVRAGTPEPPPSEAQALRAAERWVVSAGDNHRRETYLAAESVEFSTPASLCCLAAFWSGGSVAPPGQTDVLPAENLCPDMVANAVVLTGVRVEPVKALEKYKHFLALGKDIAGGKNRWKGEPPAPQGAGPPARRP
jgi:hypothetical protein